MSAIGAGPGECWSPGVSPGTTTSTTGWLPARVVSESALLEWLSPVTLADTMLDNAMLGWLELVEHKGAGPATALPDWLRPMAIGGAMCRDASSGWLLGPELL